MWWPNFKKQIREESRDPSFPCWSATARKLQLEQHFRPKSLIGAYSLEPKIRLREFP